MTAALAAQSRTVQYNLCLWGNHDVWDWGSRVGHSWRLSSDSRLVYLKPAIISLTFIHPGPTLLLSFRHLFRMGTLASGGHGDMDMMEIGNGGLTIQEQRTHFAAWIMLKSPLLLGTDLSLLNSTQLAIITNPELLAFHQDLTIGPPPAPFTRLLGRPRPLHQNSGGVVKRNPCFHHQHFGYGSNEDLYFRECRPEHFRDRHYARYVERFGCGIVCRFWLLLDIRSTS
ncbi:glycoside hydrolase superfamily [Mycena alexandri]|uniref:Alpha-galactosidase n=1 Tax=Mycena alexandri TaxID=1745969 RepID=A0AAD6TGX1_9AGAR|nr:glycoside hydrolase superfamily [Mycena alexandri]